ncbi:hypothetical protein T07_6077 [Trichinella nelsoni]|uniref:Uncharacterized protein n=1 Tax=Trichinella nelsoni TaxID=6336 RepID=A0A0V0RGJ9_9BILA|nr:hypothetical protein T07_6077 [Trichinella nelsoni]
MVCARCQTTSESLQQEINCLTVHSTALQDECLQNLADGYESNCYKSGCLIQARGDGSFCHHKRTEDEFLAVIKVRKEAKCETEVKAEEEDAALGSRSVGKMLTAQISSPYGLCTLSNNVRVAATRNKLLDGSFDSYARRMSSKFG